MAKHIFSRRRLLRGLGVSMALPWLESTAVWGDENNAPGSQAPTRMAILFAGCGFHSKEWWARGEGSQMELGRVLHPLNDFKDQTIFIQGLYNAEALKGNDFVTSVRSLVSDRGSLRKTCWADASEDKYSELLEAIKVSAKRDVECCARIPDEHVQRGSNAPFFWS